MSEDGEGQGRALTTAPARREIREVEDYMPIFDTARFEHYGRIASVMEQASLVPDCLKDKENPKVSVANCYVLVALADRLGMDPFALAQGVYVERGKLGFEGKVVHAAIKAKLRTELHFHFEGAPFKDERRVYVSDRAFDEEIIAQLKPGVSLPGWRIIDGTVGDWKTKNKDGSVKHIWLGQQSEMQLRYRGARTWARAYEPGIMLGIMSDDEVEDLWAREVETRAVALAPMHDGFGDKAQPEPEPRRRRRRAEPEGKPEGGAEPEGQAIVDAGAEGGTDEILGGDDLPADLKADPTDGASANTATAGVPNAEIEPDTSASATDASTASPAETSASGERPLEAGPEPDDDELAEEGAEDEEGEGAEEGEELPELPERVTSDGYPSADEVYHLEGDEWLWDPRRGEYARETYKNGEPFSTAGAGKEIDIYADHAPGQQDGPVPGAEAAAVEEAADDGDDENLEELDRYIAEVEAAKTWPEVKKAMAWFFTTPLWTGFKPDEQAGFRAKTWEYASQLPDVEDHAVSPSAFRLWLEHVEDPDAIKGTLAILEKQAAFEGLAPSLKDNIRRAVASRVERLTAK
jgi:hypothetical protein